MSDFGGKKRSELPDNVFGIPQERKYPMPDEKHTRSAIKLFNHVEPKYEEQLAKAVIKNMRKYNIDGSVVGPNNRLRKYLPKDMIKEYVEEACKDLTHARKLCNAVRKLARKYNANYFFVTDGASSYSNGNGKYNTAAKEMRDHMDDWERNNGFNPDDDWTNDINNVSNYRLLKESSVLEGLLKSDFSYTGIKTSTEKSEFKRNFREVFKEDPTESSINNMQMIKYKESLVGYIGFSRYTIDKKKYLGIGNFMIIKKYQHRGIGSKVISDIIDKYKDKYDEIYCYVDENNTNAISFYKKIAKVDTENLTRYGYYVSLYRKNKSSIKEETRIEDNKLPKHIYHISYINHDGETFEPRTYDNDNVKNGMERKVKRVCFSDSITRALYSIFPNGAYDADFYVHVPNSDCKVYKTTSDDIYDADITHELWIKEPVQMKCIGKIHVNGVSDKTHTIDVDKDKAGYGKKKYHETRWNWVEKYEKDETLYESYISEDDDMIKEYVEEKLNIFKKSSKDKDYRNIKLSSLKKVRITEYLIDKYKKEYPVLRHVRCKDTDEYVCDGYMWFKDDNLVCYVGSCQYTDDNTKWIVSLEILPEYRGYGLSTQILDFCVKSMNCKYLSVNKNNQLAKKIYDKYGFKVYHEDKTMYYMTLNNISKNSIGESADYNRNSQDTTTIKMTIQNLNKESHNKTIYDPDMLSDTISAFNENYNILMNELSTFLEANKYSQFTGNEEGRYKLHGYTEDIRNICSRYGYDFIEEESYDNGTVVGRIVSMSEGLFRKKSINMKQIANDIINTIKPVVFDANNKMRAKAIGLSVKCSLENIDKNVISILILDGPQDKRDTEDARFILDSIKYKIEHSKEWPEMQQLREIISKITLGDGDEGCLYFYINKGKIMKNRKDLIQESSEYQIKQSEINDMKTVISSLNDDSFKGFNFKNIAYYDIRYRSKKPIAFITIRTKPINNCIVGYVSLAVDPKYQNQGIGKSLTKKAIQWFKRERGIGFLEWWCLPDNEAFNKLANAAGFKEYIARDQSEYIQYTMESSISEYGTTAGAMVGSNQPDSVYIVNYMQNNAFSGHKEPKFGICKKGMKDLHIVGGKYNRFHYVSDVTKFKEEASDIHVYRYKGKPKNEFYDIIEDMDDDDLNIYKMVTGREIEDRSMIQFDGDFIEEECFLDTIDAIKACTEAGLLEASTDLHPVPILTETVQGRPYNYYRDLNGVFIQHEITGLRSKSYETLDDIPEAEKDIVKRGYLV